jgi:hypothetical protein
VGLSSLGLATAVRRPKGRKGGFTAPIAVAARPGRRRQAHGDWQELLRDNFRMGDSGIIRPHQLFVTSTTNALYDRVEVPGGKEHQFASRGLHSYPGARFAAATLRCSSSSGNAALFPFGMSVQVRRNPQPPLDAQVHGSILPNSAIL